MGLGVIMWIIYGVAISRLAVVLTNILGIILISTLIFMKYRYSEK